MAATKTRKGYCHVVEGACLAPAGWRVGSGIAHAPPGPVVDCAGCGEEVCLKCSTKRGKRRLCVDCYSPKTDKTSGSA